MRRLSLASLAESPVRSSELLYGAIHGIPGGEDLGKNHPQFDP
jgi:hypothetical protein